MKYHTQGEAREISLEAIGFELAWGVHDADNIT